MIGVVACLYAPTAAVASHSSYGFVGGEPSSDGGWFGTLLGGVAINQGTGDVYVAEGSVAPPNERIQRFDTEGRFELAWGRGVRTGGDVPEICTVADLPCFGGSRGTGEGSFNSARWVAVSPITGHVFVRDASSTPVGVATGFHVQEFDANGGFVRRWGWGVQDGAPAFQICTANCRLGLQGSGAGQLGAISSNISSGIAVSPVDGDVFVADPGNRRILRFNADGSLDASPVIGSAANFGSGRPLALAIDSQGILYAVDSESSGHIERYDTAGVHGSQGFLAPIAAPPLLTGTDTFVGGLAVHLDPEGDGAVGATTDRLYVARNPAAGDTVIQQFDSPGEVAPPLETLPRHGVGMFGTRVIRGLAYHSASNRLYATTDQGTAGFGFFILSEGAGGASIDAITGSPSAKTATSATLTGQVDPDDGLVRYRFEYSVDGASWTAAPWRRVSGSGHQPVSEPVTGLQPNRLYLVRIVVRKALGTDNVVPFTSAEEIFLTLPSAPTAVTRPVHAYDDDSAWLVADINANSQSTHFRFEWGISTDYGQVLPLEDIEAGSGGVPRTFQRELSGLEPNTTYHYRVVAENDAGAASGEDMTFTTRPPFQGHAPRAYEQVSPVNKQGVDVNRNLSPSVDATTTYLGPYPATSSGDRKLFTSHRALDPADWGGHIRNHVYVTERDADVGWTVKYSALPPMTIPAEVDAGVRLISDDLSRVVLASTLSGFDPFSLPGIFHSDLVSGIRALLAPFAPGSDDAPRAISTDGGTVAFNSFGVLTGDVGIPGTSVRKAYAWSTASGTKLVGINPVGAPFSSQTDPHAITNDGGHVLFTAGTGSAAEIYRRDDGADTAHVSASQRSAPDPSGQKGKVFLGAAGDFGPGGDGSAFFTSTEKLTDAVTNSTTGAGDLYRFDSTDGSLTNVSATTLSPGGAEVLGLVDSSTDGDAVYYVARGRVTGEAVQGQPNLYLWQDDGAGGETRLVATLADGPGCTGSDLAGLDSCVYTTSADRRRARVSTDGMQLVFQSTRDITGYRNNGFSQVYLYDADVNGGQLTCVSCRPDGAPATVDTPVPPSLLQESHVLSSDGRVFFETAEPLVSVDGNGVQDVYEWDEGHLELISTGSNASDSWFDGASADGDSVFFVTREQLVAQDDDDLADVYVARVGGGIAAQNFDPPPAGEACTNDACKPAPAPPPSTSGPSTQDLQGEGNAVDDGVRSCAGLSKRAKRLGASTRRARRAARRLAAAEKPGRARRMRQRARRRDVRADRVRSQLRRCRTDEGRFS